MGSLVDRATPPLGVAQPGLVEVEVIGVHHTMPHLPHEEEDGREQHPLVLDGFH